MKYMMSRIFFAAAMTAISVVFVAPTNWAKAYHQYPESPVVAPDNIHAIRAELISDVFGGSLPRDSARVTGASYAWGSPYVTLSTGARYFPRGESRLLVFHAGHHQHAEDPRVGGMLIQQALDSGWDVLALDMPDGDHGRFANVPKPLSPFMTPIAKSLNYAVDRGQYMSIVMCGLSGGGWSTVLYAAMDTRINMSVPVAGSWPKYLRYRSGNGASIGDFEQTLPGLHASYLDLYAMGADGRVQHQVFNDRDPCCFAGRASLEYLDPVRQAAHALSGEFTLTVSANDHHSVDASVFDLILDSPPFGGEPTGETR